MGLKKGQTNNPKGRPKGAKDKVQRTVKESILEVFNRLDGVDGFLTWATANPDEFYKGYFRLAPKEVEVSGPDGGAIPNEFTVRFVKPE